MWTASILLSLIVPVFTFPTTTLNQCDGVLGCNNRGTCAGTLEEGFYCVCDPGYFGLRCQLPDEEKNQEEAQDRPCDSQINCNGHGFCSGGVANDHCNCYPGWYGVRCQIPVQ